MRWDASCHENIYKTYREIGSLCELHAPNFSVVDFARLKPDLWKRICKIEKDLDHPNTTVSGIKTGIDQLYRCWKSLIDYAKKENKKLVDAGISLSSINVAFQIYRTEEELYKGDLLVTDIHLSGLFEYLEGNCTLHEAIQRKEGTVIRNIGIVDDGSVRSFKAQQRKNNSKKQFNSNIESTSVSWDKKEDDEMPEIEGFEEDLQIEELDLTSSMKPETSQNDSGEVLMEIDFDIVDSEE